MEFVQPTLVQYPGSHGADIIRQGTMRSFRPTATCSAAELSQGLRTCRLEWSVSNVISYLLPNLLRDLLVHVTIGIY